MLSQNAQQLLAFLSKKDQDERQDKIKPKINIRSSMGMFAFVYEKVRNFVDYQEEHLLLRRAINRILVRRAKTNSDSNYLSNSLITELLMARYLESGTLSECKISETEKILAKYLLLYKEPLMRTFQSKENTLDFLFSLASREIEELLSPGSEDQLINFTLKIFEERIVWVDGGEDEQKRAKIFICLMRSLSKYDDRTIYYKLWRLYFSDWSKADGNVITKVAEKFKGADSLIKTYINDPLGEPLLRIFKKQIAPFEILRDLINKDYASVQQYFSSEQSLIKGANATANTRYRRAMINLRRSAVNSFIYIFITKMILALAIEIPYEVYFSSKLNVFPLLINVLFPPGLMVFLSLSVESPKDENTKKIISEITSIIFGNNDFSTININLNNKKSAVLTAVFDIVYLFVFLVVFGLTLFILKKLQFSIVSMIIFFFFISTISFFAFRIRSSFKELVIGEEDQNIISILFDFFMTPFIKLGRIISSGLKDINIFIFFFDIIIEAPFKLILGVFEEWILFLKEKKEQALNVIN